MKKERLRDFFQKYAFILTMKNKKKKKRETEKEKNHTSGWHMDVKEIFKSSNGVTWYAMAEGCLLVLD